MYERRTVWPIIATIVAIIVIIGLLLGVNTVRYDEVKLVTRMGKLTGRVLEPGWNFITPLIEGTVTYSTQEIVYETSQFPGDSDADYVDYPIDSETSDGQPVTVMYSVKFKIIKDRASEVAEDIGRMDDVVEKVAKFYSRSIGRQELKSYTADELYSSDGVYRYQDAVFEKMNKKFELRGLELIDFNVRDTNFSEKYIASVENKQIQRENVQAAEYESQQAAWAAESKIEQARGEAESKKLEADAEAYYIKTVQESLSDSPLAIEWEFVKQLSTANWMMLPSDGLSKYLPVRP